MARPRKTPSLDNSVWAAALEGLEMQRSRIDDQIRQVRTMMGQPRRGRPPASASTSTPEKVAATPAAASSPAGKTKKRVLSAAARKRIAAAQKKRWADFREKSEAPAE